MGGCSYVVRKEGNVGRVGRKYSIPVGVLVANLSLVCVACAALFVKLCRRFVTYPSAESGGEVVKDEVGKSLRHGADIRDVVSHYYVIEREIRRRAVRQVAHDQTVWRSRVPNTNIRDVTDAPRIDSLSHDNKGLCGHRTRLSSGLMDDHQVSYVVGSACVHQRVDLMVSSVHALGSRKNEFHFLQ